MQTPRVLTLLTLVSASAFSQTRPGWRQTFVPDPAAAAAFVEQAPSGVPHATPSPAPAAEPAGMDDIENARSLGEAAAPPPAAATLSSVMGLPPGNEADAITPEIQSLADGLRHDAVKIFEFVRNNIKYECYFGSKKGARLTLLEGSGNDFDQCALLASLLRASGLSATYEFGPCIFSYGQFVSWWGLKATPYSYQTDAEFAGEYGFPAGSSAAEISKWRKWLAVYEYSKNAGFFYVEPWSYGGTEYFSLPLCCVRHGGALICPAYKTHTTTAGIGLAAATGYDRADMLAAAGGVAGTPDSITSLDEAAIASRLTTQTTNLLAAIRTGHDAKSPLQITGGRTVNRVSYSTLADIPGMLPDPYALAWCPFETGDAIPVSRMSSVLIQAGTYDATTQSFTTLLYQHEIPMPALAGGKLSLSFSGDTASIRLDETLLGSAFTVAGASVDVRIEAKHNHYLVTRTGSSNPPVPADYTISGATRDNQAATGTYLKGDTRAYVFAYTFGDPAKVLRLRQETLDTYLRANLPDTDWRVLTEGLNIMGLTYYKQMHDMERATEPLYGISSVAHHTFGRASQEAAFYLDVFLNLGNHGQGDIDYGQTDRYGGLSTLIASAMEHGVIEQTQGPAHEAVSTVRMVRTANAQGIPVYRATPANWSSVSPLLQNYSSASKAAIAAEFSDPLDHALVPASGTMTVAQWTGGGYAIEGPAKAIMRISGHLNGGYSAYAAAYYNIPAATAAYTATPGYEYTTPGTLRVSTRPLPPRSPTAGTPSKWPPAPSLSKKRTSPWAPELPRRAWRTPATTIPTAATMPAPASAAAGRIPTTSP